MNSNHMQALKLCQHQFKPFALSDMIFTFPQLCQDLRIGNCMATLRAQTTIPVRHLRRVRCTCGNCNQYRHLCFDTQTHLEYGCFQK